VRRDSCEDKPFDFGRRWIDSVLQKKVLTPNGFASTRHVERRLLAFLVDRNRTARPIQWSYTSKRLLSQFSQRRRLAAS